MDTYAAKPIWFYAAQNTHIHSSNITLLLIFRMIIVNGTPRWSTKNKEVGTKPSRFIGWRCLEIDITASIRQNKGFDMTGRISKVLDDNGITGGLWNNRSSTNTRSTPFSVQWRIAPNLWCTDLTLRCLEEKLRKLLYLIYSTSDAVSVPLKTSLVMNHVQSSGLPWAKMLIP